MKESQFQGWVVDVFQRHGWVVKHVPTPMRPVAGGKFVPDARGRGLLDLLMVHPDPPRLVFAECKTGTDLSEEQTRMFHLLRAVARQLAESADGRGVVGVYIFRPGVEPLIEAIARGATVPS